MHQIDGAWGVVLAAGDGNRLQSLTRDTHGTVIPKQFCSFRGQHSLLRVSIERLQRVVDLQRIVVVVAAEHRPWWEPQVGDLDPDNVIVQPSNRGTACGIMLPLLHIADRDSRARIVVTPSDHFIEDEATYAASIRKAAGHVGERPFLLVVLGIEPDYPADDLGWIVGSDEEGGDLEPVVEFVEKPDRDDARYLMAMGALWNSLTFVATAEGLLTRFKHSLPWLADQFTRAVGFGGSIQGGEGLIGLYKGLPSVDFSEALLQRSSRRFHVLRVPGCGWTDLGTPGRIFDCVRKWGCPIGPTCSHENGNCELPHAPLDLARAVSRQPGEIIVTTPGG